MAKEWAFHKKEKATMTKEKTIKCGRLWTRGKKVSKGEVSPYQILLRSQVRWDENYWLDLATWQLLIFVVRDVWYTDMNIEARL